MKLRRRHPTARSNFDERVLLIANPSSDVYGADLQMLESVTAVINLGWRVVVLTPEEGPLRELLEQRGASVRIINYPVIRRENASVSGMLKLILGVVKASPRIWRAMSEIKPSALYVNTITIPFWLALSKLHRTPSVCHVHEAEADDKQIIRIMLNAPLLMANKIIVISQSSFDSMVQVFPSLHKKASLIYNGVPGPSQPSSPSKRHEGPRRLAVIGRLSPRKGTLVALHALAQLREQGVDAVLEVCGTAFPGYEWFDEELRARAAQPDLQDCVTFSGYVRPVWSVLERAEVVLAPSLREPFGNVVVEAQLAERVVVASASMGHLETVLNGQTGVLVPANDASALAQAISELLADQILASRLAKNAKLRAEELFAPERYRQDIAHLIAQVSHDYAK